MKSLNMVEIIPYESFNQKIRIVKQELLKNRYVEVWDNYIYSVKRNLLF